MKEFHITNVSIYKAIAVEAYHEMVRLDEVGRRPKTDGAAGFIMTYDPCHKSFKQALIAIVFAGIWIEAFLHLMIVRHHGEEKYKDYDFKTYEDKLMLLGFTDEALLTRLKRFRETRKEIVHEKAHFDSGTYKTAQSEATLAFRLLSEIEKLLK